MAAKLVFLQLQHVCQIVLSLWGLRHSFVAISNLQKYEETTKKLAKWSAEVERQLFKTRSTQAAGAVTILSTLIASSTLIFFAQKLPTWLNITSSPIMLAVTFAARAYIKSFWTPSKDTRGKDKGTEVPLPNLNDYNLAVKKTEDLLTVLEYLEYSWAITSLTAWVIGYGVSL